MLSCVRCCANSSQRCNLGLPESGKQFVIGVILQASEQSRASRKVELASIL